MLFNLGAFAQQKDPSSINIKVNIQEKPISELLKIIEKQTIYKFSYDQNIINLSQKISLKAEGSLTSILNIISDQQNLEFGIIGNSISIRKAPKKVDKPTRSITGTVRDKETGTPIPGANIFVKGTKQGAITNNNGEFIYRVNTDKIDKTILVFSFLGMKTQEINIGNQVFFNINLETEPLGMNEVVVTGSYTKDKRREDVVGSISQVNAERLQTNRPIESFDKMLEGLVAGVQVETTTELNTPIKINIRGLGSLPTIGASRTTSTQPLFVIDGVPMYEQQRGDESINFNGESYLNPLSNVNPDDIKSISILKDATASALYGANGANGVIIITTKNGKAGKTVVNLSADAGVATFINQYKWLSGPQYYSLLREAYINGGRSATEASQISGSKTTNTDWFDLTQRNALYQNYGLEVSGGSGTTTFRFSGGYRNQQSSTLTNDLKKIYGRLRVDHEFSDKFKVGINLSPTFSRSSSLSDYGAVTLPPNLEPYTNGTFTDFLGVPNPLAVFEQNEDRDKGFDFIGNINGSYKITNHLSVSGTLGANVYQNKQLQYYSALNATGRTANGRLQIYDRVYNSYIGFVQATYDRTFKHHSFNFLVGTQVENKITDLLRGSGNNFTFDRLRVLSAAGTTTSASSNSENATVSYYSSLGYDFAKKYYLNLNARIDKSSIFGGDKQVALNGSVGASWIISKENFLLDNKILTFLKLRVTYGSTGNSRIGNYSAKGLYSFGSGSSTVYNGNIVATPDGTAAPNPDLGWEKNYKFNLGLDFNLFGKVDVIAEYYNNRITDLISSSLVPYETGFQSISANTSTTRNRGFELTISSQIVTDKNFSWNLAYNFGANKNKLISYNKGTGATYSSADDAAALREGNSTSAIYGYQWAGVDPQTGMEMFYGINGKLSTASEINALPISSTSVLGDRLPQFQGGLINSFNVYRFNFSFNILYSYGEDKLIYYINEADGRNLQNRNQSVNLVDRWQKPGDITDIPQLLINRNIVSNSSRYIYDVSYLKLSNVSLNYKFEEKTLSRLHLQNLSIFVNATNLFYVYKDAGTKGRNGIAEMRFTTPETSAFTAGIRIGL
ncbi:SusC/RagA family TonB-linked outer membrane protein [Pedobacter mendelii]|uniref:SusC/RagA family TonB-linked outer membrane protein n=2 Tax=Pedobacter mendelii TaxID=1908240 RepID=A0ABQ2BG68_9SPHI|nr:SusC/RagA family TonB-linked outer membrane protein [Pedobacter mendelii]